MHAVTRSLYVRILLRLHTRAPVVSCKRFVIRALVNNSERLWVC